MDSASAFQLRFQSLYRQGRGFAFPCDAQGRVDVDHMSLHCRENYVQARALVGREFTSPTVEVAGARAMRVQPVLARTQDQEVDA